MRNQKGLWIISIAGVCLFSSAVLAGTIHVKADGTGDYTTIQAAINASVNGDTIIVSPATYFEKINLNGKNVILTSTNPNDPNVVETTIIDAGGSGSAVTFAGTETSVCELKGFTITNGYTNGGIYGNHTQASIANCMITDNKAILKSGGGLADCHGLITNCTITSNTVGKYGGGLYNCDGTIANCTITSNIAGDKGGGLYHCGGLITNCTISNNSAEEYSGGGLYECDGMISNCTISANTAPAAGGLYDCDGQITNCMISGNTAENYDGGGLYGCDDTIINCMISGNTANYGGGGLYGCAGTIANSVITGNIANNNGGGLSACNGPIINCTITGNTANNNGGGLYGCNGTITNSIVWNNNTLYLGAQLYFSSTPTFSCIQGWIGGGTGNINSDPLFADTSATDPTDWDLHILGGSFCIDSGTNTPPAGLPTIDVEGFPRPSDGDLDGNPVADMGAYEFQISEEPYLDVNPKSLSFIAHEVGGNPMSQNMTIKNWGNQTLNWSLGITDKPDWLTIPSITGTLESGESESIVLSVNITGLSEGQYSYSFEVFDLAAQNSPQSVTVDMEVIGPIYVPGDYSTIQAAIDAAVNGDMIIVAEGVYTGTGNRDIDFKGKKITVQSAYPNCYSVIASTIIDCEGLETNPHRAFYFHSGEDASSVINGFTIKKGYAYDGGGILCDSSSPTIIDCDFVDCTAENWGGGIQCYKSSAVISNCKFNGNSAFEGGAITTRSDWGYLCSPHIKNCHIFNNMAFGSGGGINSDCLSTPIISNCLINGNFAGTYGGGGISIFQSTPHIINCTVVNNTSDNQGGGILDWYPFESGATLENCIVWGNISPFGQMTLSSSSEMTVNYCDIENGLVGIWVSDAILN